MMIYIILMTNSVWHIFVAKGHFYNFWLVFLLGTHNQVKLGVLKYKRWFLKARNILYLNSYILSYLFNKIVTNGHQS